MFRVLFPKLLLIGALAALLAWSRQLDAVDSARRAGSVSITPLIAPERRADIKVAAVSLERAGETFLYARTRGVWRCLSRWGADAMAADVQALVDVVMQASSVVQSDRSERFADYGIGTDSTWTLRLHGGGVLKQEDRDTLFEVELGDVLTALGGGFARVAGEQVVRVLDVDPRGLIEPKPGSGGVPLLDPHLVPTRWPAGDGQVVRIVVERVDGVAFRLELRTRDLTDEQRMARASPVEWVLTAPDGSESALSPDHAIAYTVFLRLAEVVDRADPATGPSLGLEPDKILGRVGLVAADGEAAELFFGPQRPDGMVPVLCSVSGPVMFLDPDVAQLFLTTPAELTDPTGPNPWEPWLIAAGEAALEARIGAGR